MSQVFGRKIKNQKIISRLKNKDKEAFINLYDEQAADIYRFVYFKVGRIEEAKDLASIIFLKTWNHIQTNSLVDAKTLRGLLYKIARTSIVDYYRDSGHKRDLSLDDEKKPLELADESINLDEAVEKNRRLALIKSKLPLLKDEYREIIVLRFINELEIDEIMEATGKSRGSVRVLIHRSITALKKMMPAEEKAGKKSKLKQPSLKL